jgi:crotonobetainyl-CoA:carnitine CoA-transferase CaiB-like acyl-CoA transferase
MKERVMANLLENIRIIDWTVWQQGPIASLMLGDLGAEVIKIEEYKRGDPGRGTKRAHDGAFPGIAFRPSSYFEVNNRSGPMA